MLCRRRRRDRSRGSEAESLLTIKYAHVLTLRTTHIHNHRCCCAVSCGREEKKNIPFSVSLPFFVFTIILIFSPMANTTERTQNTLSMWFSEGKTLSTLRCDIFSHSSSFPSAAAALVFSQVFRFTRDTRQFYTEKKRRNLMRKMPRKKIEKKLDFSNFRENFYRIVVVEIPHRFWYRHTLDDADVVCELQLFLNCTFLGWCTTRTRRDFVSDARRRLHAMRYPPKHIFSATVDSNKKFPQSEKRVSERKHGKSDRNFCCRFFVM